MSKPNWQLPRCPECLCKGKLKSGKDVFPHREDLFKKWFYVCEEHDTRVGCHRDSKEPMSLEMAGAQLRLLRSQVHGMFDPLWKNKHFNSRVHAYLWLSLEMNISIKKCHVSYFNENLCHQAIGILHSYFSELKTEEHKKTQEAKWQSKTSLF